MKARVGAAGARRRARLTRCALLCALLALPPLAQAQSATALQARYQALRGPLAHNQFGRPLYLESSESEGTLKGDVYARIEQPYAVVGPALQAMGPWCDILILHPNVKRCRAPPPGADAALILDLGRKVDQPLADAFRFEFLHAVTATPEYLRVVLRAAEGPLGTTRYRIVLEAVALEEGGTFMHLSYAYGQGAASRVATQMYLATVGRSKVGFSIVGRKSGGRPVFIGSTRGVIERNAMRVYLAIEAYLGAMATPDADRLERRLRDWYLGSERYATQLHELERDAYLDMKRREVRRQQAPATVAAAGPGGAPLAKARRGP